MAKTMKSRKEETPSTIDISAEASESPAAIATPMAEEIGQRAYEIYLARGGGEGHAIEDWLQAERELLGINDGDQVIPE
ncbi:MAG: DUF2934 domain-containing protein [Blastocatellia bacterium]|nr:DUF2934 domain-containing protein [Blastocatellia bacterium]